MPVVDAWYESRRGQHPAAFITYWDAFIGRRMAKNDALMKRQLDETDPVALGRQMEILRRSIASLNTEKAKMQRAAIEGQWDVVAGLTRGLMSAEAARLNAEGRVTSEKIKARTDLEVQYRNEQADFLASVGVTNSERVAGHRAAAVAAASTPSAAGAMNPAEAFKSRLKAAQTDARAPSRTAAGDAIAYSFWLEAVRSNHPDAAAAIQDGFFNKQPPTGYMQRTYPQRTEEQRDQDSAKITKGSVGSINWEKPLQAALALVGTGERDNLPDVLASVDKQIASAEADLEALRLEQRAAKDIAERPGAPFLRNSVLENPFTRRHGRQDLLDDIGETAPSRLEHGVNMVAAHGSRPKAVRYMADPANYDGFEYAPGVSFPVPEVMDDTMGLFEWMNEQLNLVVAGDGVSVARHKTIEENIESLRELVNTLAILPPDVRRLTIALEQQATKAMGALSTVAANKTKRTPEQLDAAVSGAMKTVQVLLPDPNKVDFTGDELVDLMLEQAENVEDDTERLRAVADAASAIARMPEGVVASWGPILTNMVDKGLQTRNGPMIMANTRRAREAAQRKYLAVEERPVDLGPAPTPRPAKLGEPGLSGHTILYPDAPQPEPSPRPAQGATPPSPGRLTDRP